MAPANVPPVLSKTAGKQLVPGPQSAFERHSPHTPTENTFQTLAPPHLPDWHALSAVPGLLQGTPFARAPFATHENSPRWCVDSSYVGSQFGATGPQSASVRQALQVRIFRIPRLSSGAHQGCATSRQDAPVSQPSPAPPPPQCEPCGA
jgi:hypothetical protein